MHTRRSNMSLSPSWLELQTFHSAYLPSHLPPFKAQPSEAGAGSLGRSRLIARTDHMLALGA